MDEELARLVRARAGGRCEYCRMPSGHDFRPFEIEHVIAKKHLGPTTAGNLALSCAHCNRHKGSDPAGYDRVARRPRLVALYHPRRHPWSYHFRTEGGRILGRTATGRVTVQVLSMNDPDQLAFREQLLRYGVWPPG